MAHSRFGMAAPNRNPAPSGARHAFDALVKQIDLQKRRLAEWQAMVPAYQQKFAREYEPLLHSFDAHRIDLVRLLDRAFTDKSLSKSDRAKIKDIICSITAEFITQHGNEDLKPIYNKYSKTDFDSETCEANQAIKSMMQNLLGIELGDDFDIRSAEKILEQIGDKLRQPFEPRLGTRTKSAKDLQRHGDAGDISQSIREVFRKLASALHPSAEQDSDERSRKAALMQRADAAYRQRDLPQLLDLQLELERIDRAAIDTISAERLKQYNRILTEQSADLQREIDQIEFSFSARFDFPPAGTLSPAKAMSDLEQDIERIRQDIDLLANELSALGNIRNLRAWLKTYRITRRPYFEDEMFERIDLDALFGSR